MKKYKVTTAMSLHAGMVVLDEDQAKRRAHAVVKVKGNVYDIKKMISFKIGETFRYDGEINGVLAQRLEDAKTGDSIAGQKAKNKHVKAKEKAAKKAANAGSGDDATGDGDNTNTGSDSESGDGEDDNKLPATE